jgi:hypothetical protein
MSILIRTAFAALTLASLFCGCGARKETAAIEVIDKKYPIDPDASIRINDPHGSISIRGTDSSEVQLHATKVASSADQLKNISVSVTAQQNGVSIKTNFVRSKAKPFLGGGDRVDYELSIPRSLKITRLDVDDGKVSIESVQTSELRANVVDGELELRNCSGDIHVAVQNGDLALLYNAREPRPSSTDARVLHGTLTLSLPRSAAFHLRAETTKGTITSAFAQTVEVKGGALRKIDISSGQAPRSEIQLEVMTGNIIIADASADARTASHSASGPNSSGNSH